MTGIRDWQGLVVVVGALGVDTLALAAGGLRLSGRLGVGNTLVVDAIALSAGGLRLGVGALAVPAGGHPWGRFYTCDAAEAFSPWGVVAP